MVVASPIVLYLGSYFVAQSKGFQVLDEIKFKYESAEVACEQSYEGK